MTMANELERFSDEVLNAELRRRKKEKDEREKPKPLDTIDTSPLVSICQGYIDEIASGIIIDSDTRHYIYETAMNCVFGRNVWKWINARMR